MELGQVLLLVVDDFQPPWINGSQLSQALAKQTLGLAVRVPTTAQQLPTTNKENKPNRF